MVRTSRSTIYHLRFMIHYLRPSRFLLLDLGPSLKLFEPSGNIAITDINPIHFRQRGDGVRQIIHLFIGAAEFILQGLVFFGGSSRNVKALLEPKHLRSRHLLLYETVAQHVTALKESACIIRRSGQSSGYLKLADGLVQKIHLLVGGSHVVVCFEVFGS